MNGSFRIARLFGINVFVHWSFLLWLGVVFYMDASVQGPRAGVNAVVFTVALFVCVVMHEYGHALTARAFGIQTQDITVMMLGGVARLLKLRTTPTRELLIAVAGPAVNIAIAGALLPVIIYRATGSRGVQMDFVGADLIQRLFMANIVLVVFNMIPCFPMDGGRVLRALLAYFMSYATATLIAARVGQVIAAIFAVLGVVWGPITLALIGFFVFTGAERELRLVKWQDEMLRQHREREQIAPPPPGALGT